jgi:poly-beta-1,6-N-acetyl-D-glucosamine N-deacetylase
LLPKRWPFFLVILVSFGLVVTAGLLGGVHLPNTYMPKVQHFPPVPTSISTSGDDTAAARERTVEKEDAVVPRQWYRNRVVVLTYHHVSNQSNQRYVIDPDQFARHMAFLRENDLHPISLSEFLRFVDTGVLSTDNAVLITFDDGYESYYTHAFPVLRQYQFPSVNFAIAGRLRDTAERKRENMTTPLTRQQINEMLVSGLVDIGSHTYSLHEQAASNEWGEWGPETAPVYMEDLQRLENEQEYRNRLYVDFTMSRVGLSDLVGRPVDTISLPFGFFNDIVLQTAQQAGYRYVFNSNPGVVTPGVNPLKIPRFDVGSREMDTAQLHQLFTKAKNGFEGEQE